MAYDSNPWGDNTAPKTPTRLGGSAPTLSARVGDTFGRTKEVASTGIGKTKVAASAGLDKSKVVARKIKVGFNWVRLKYKKSKLFQKK